MNSMSSIEMKERIITLIEQHNGNDAWLARVYEILSGENDANLDEWEPMSPAQVARLEESRKQHREGKVVSQQEVVERSSKWQLK